MNQQLLNTQFNNIRSSSDPLLQRTIDMLSAKCSSLWLTAFPIQSRNAGFYLSRISLRLRYGWKLARLPSHCACGASFSADHAMICDHGGLTFIRHNELRNLTASWLYEVCHNVVVELPYSHSPVIMRPLFWHLLIAEMMLGQISMSEAFGVEDRVHF